MSVSAPAGTDPTSLGVDEEAPAARDTDALDAGIRLPSSRPVVLLAVITLLAAALLIGARSADLHAATLLGTLAVLVSLALPGPRATAWLTAALTAGVLLDLAVTGRPGTAPIPVDHALAIVVFWCTTAAVLGHKRAMNAVRETHEQLRLAYERCPDPYLCLDERGSVRSINAAALALLGEGGREPVGRPFEELVEPADRERAKAALASIDWTGTTDTEIELRLTAAGGEARWMSVRVNAVRASRSTPALAYLICRDRTASRLAEQDLGDMNASLARAQTLAGLGRWTRDLRTGEDWWSAEVFEILGLDPVSEAPSRRRFLARVHPADRATVMRTYDEAAVGSGAFGVVFRVLRSDGTVRFVHSRAEFKHGSDGRAARIVGIFLDITHWKLAELELARVVDEKRRLTLHALEAQEAERRWVAKELHDELGQSLVAIRMAASALHSSAPSLECAETASEICRLADATVDSLRTVTHRLRPAALDRLGLGDAVRELVDEWRARQPDVHYTFSTHGRLRELSEEVQIALYRTTQESLTNAAKHAAATWVEVRLVNDRSGPTGNPTGRSVALRVRNDGADSQPGIFGVGLIGMRERMESVGGTFESHRLRGGVFEVEARLEIDARRIA